MASAIISGRAFPAPWLPARTIAVRSTARCRNALGLVATVTALVRAPSRPGASSAVLVAIPLVLVAIPLALDVIFAARCGTASAACPRGAHRVAPLAKPLTQRVDLAADRGNGSRFAGVDQTALHFVGQLGELRRRSEQLCALLD
ncbi:MAG TPA: hypothetical protein VNW50_21675 [Streptosporangiaceae bacterium]|nr:hypothetical protein [Streptosporangiaceae bacterium]